jgi:hypothetical protein
MINSRTYPNLHHFGFTSKANPKVTAKVINIMAHKEDVTLYLNLAGTIQSLIDLIDICETDVNGITITTPYTL